MRLTSETAMNDNETAFPGLADPEPFDGSDELEDEGPSEAVAQVMAAAAEAELDCYEMLDLALCAIAELAADLADGIDQEQGPDSATVAALERLQVAAEILAGVDLGGDEEEGEGEDEAEAV